MRSISRRTVAKGALGSVVALALGRAHSAGATQASPLFNPFKFGAIEVRDSDAPGTFTAAARALDEFGLAYLHVVESPPARIAASIRAAFKNALILNENYDASTGAAALASGAADAIAYGRHFLANPDLVERFRRNERLNAPDFKTFYTEGAKGYTDYPAMG